MIASQISTSLGIREQQVKAVISLFEDGATIPFISRYRKERTGGLDEVQIADIVTLNTKLIELNARKKTILGTIDEQGKLTEELREKIINCNNSVELEDIYLPYKPKRRTRAAIAKEKGLEPLANWILEQKQGDIYEKATQFLTDEVETAENALAGARDIIAETINEDERVRTKIRKIYSREAILSSSVIKDKETDGIKYSDYFDYAEPLNRIPSHRFLAAMRGVSEGFLRLKAVPESEKCIDAIDSVFIRSRTEAAEQIKIAIADSYKRLIAPSLESEFINAAKEKADKEAINVFAENLRQLLLAAPLGERAVLAIDPGYRTGCKVVCLGAQGDLLHNETIFPHAPQNDFVKAGKKLTSLVDAYKIEAIAIGNGTASRETERFVKKQPFNREVQVFVVSEDGASVYSASSAAREEFPQYDVTVRGSVSIGRRLIDPLSELVKIDPKSIGVGQYQHDVDQTELKNSLNMVVESCVNKVGVNLNTASKYILSYISGLGPQLAQNIIDFRSKNGAFTARTELKKVARLGPKAFEQCAGFLRITNSKEPLDNSSVHPESYYIVKQMAADLNCTVADLLKNETLRNSIDINKYTTADIGLPTLTDILQELAKPGKDPRSVAEVFEFAEGIHRVEDLRVGMELPGIVTNITAFGAFVDVGVKQDGLVHLSQMAHAYVSDPNTIVKLHQHVIVKVLEIDIPRKRISLRLCFHSPVLHCRHLPLHARWVF